MGLDLRIVDRLTGEHLGGLLLELGDRLVAGSGNRLVGGDDQALEPGRVVERRQGHHHHHGGAVRVRDDALVVLRGLGVDPGDDQRHVLMHAPETGVVDNDGSGLDENGLHSLKTTEAWLGMPTGADTAYLQYEFEAGYKPAEKSVWDYNSEFEKKLGVGLKDVTAEYHVDGAPRAWWPALPAAAVLAATLAYGQWRTTEETTYQFLHV
mgnify:CR=1 FL=1